MNEVVLLNAEAGSSPSGTGSFNYFSNFTVVVENLAFNKQVNIFGHDLGTGGWHPFPCSFAKSLPGNVETWTAHVNASRIDQFVVEYQVSGNTFWDNNFGNNYILDTQAAEETDGVGTAVLKPEVLAVEFAVDAAGALSVDVLVKNIAFAKQVGIVYTTNNWQTFQNAFGVFQRGFPPATTPAQINAELWKVEAFVGAGQKWQFAVFYNVSGHTSWDNNFSLNYSF
jgi:carbohydrate/starch-binding protein with CBM21 domain